MIDRYPIGTQPGAGATSSANGAGPLCPPPEVAEETRDESRGLGDLIKELRDEATTLIRQEVALAKTEVSEKAAKAGRNVAYLVAGGAVAYAGALVLLLGVALLATWALIELGLNRYIAYWLAPLIVGAVVVAVGYFLVQKAISTLKEPEQFVPQKTVDSIQENAQWAKHKVTT